MVVYFVGVLNPSSHVIKSNFIEQVTEIIFVYLSLHLLERRERKKSGNKNCNQAG